jgi:hypothetical protein
MYVLQAAILMQSARYLLCWAMTADTVHEASLWKVPDFVADAAVLQRY